MGYNKDKQYQQGGDTMDFTTVLNSRKSIRSFTGEPVCKDALKKILHAANAAPVGLGKYDSVHLTVVQNKALLDALEKATAIAFHANDRSFLYNAPQLIIVSSTAEDNVGCSNAAIIAHNMALAAVDAGVGVCHIWGCIMALKQDPALIGALGIPEGFAPCCTVAIGKTEEIYAPRTIPEDRIQTNYI